jgi:glycosyltransferase involved in cell wall biosynthesis
MMRVSIVITNYNFGRFLRDAIQSALNVRWPDKEVIVCDDGSTDDSRAIIESFSDRIVAIYKANGGQPSAANAAFASITGDIVFFLDSDDLLLPQAAEVVIHVWDKETTKVQFPMIVIDQNGMSNGKVWPDFRIAHPPEQIRSELLRTGRYPTSSTSGNAFDVAFLRKVFPVPEDLVGFDSSLCMTAPLCGNVKTITEPLAKFRVHATNTWSQQTWKPEKLLYYIDEEIKRDSFVRRWAGKVGLTLNPASLRANDAHLMNRLACKRVLPERYPFPEEGRGRLMLDGIKAATNAPFANRKTKLLIAFWFVLAGVAPRPMAVRAIKARYVPLSRSRALESVLRLVGAAARQK